MTHTVHTTMDNAADLKKIKVLIALEVAKENRRARKNGGQLNRKGNLENMNKTNMTHAHTLHTTMNNADFILKRGELMWSRRVSSS